MALFGACGRTTTLEKRFGNLPPLSPGVGCENITFNFSGGPNAPDTKTYVIWDMNPDGTFAHTGNGGNGNLGHSAQIGASCCRPAADSIVTAQIPDDRAHTLSVYALDSNGYFFQTNNPVATFQIAAAKRSDCQSSW